MVERVADGEGFEPPTSGSGGLCPIQARLPAPDEGRFQAV